MKRLFFAVIVSLVLGACSQDTSSGSYAMIVVVNGTEYNGTEEKIMDFEVEKAIGEITKRVPANTFPSDNQSNIFNDGAIIFSVKGSKDFIIVEDTEGDRHLLQKSPGNNQK